MDINTISNTLRESIAKNESLYESDLNDENIVNLYEIDFSKIDVEVKRHYAVNIVSGMLYSIEGEEYKENIYHTPRLGVAKFSKMTKVGIYEMIIDAGQTVNWDSVQIFYDKYVENSLTCKVYTSDDEIVWKEENLTLGNSMEKEEKYTISSADNTQFLKVEIQIQDVEGKNSEVDYVLVNFYKYKDTGIEPETTVTGAEQIAGIWTIPTPSNGETEANGTATVVQKVTLPADGGEYILDLEEIYGNPTTVVKITKPDDTVETITITDSKDLSKITIPAGSKIEITTTLTGGNGIGPVKVLKKDTTLSTKRLEQTNDETEEIKEWITVAQKKYVYNNGGKGFWEKCFVNDVQVDETGIIIESETAIKRIRVRYQTSSDGRSWSSYFTNIQDANNIQYLKVIVDYQTIEGNQYGDISNNKVKVILNDGSWKATFKDEDDTSLFSKRVYFTSSQLTGTIELPNLDDKEGKIFAGWKTGENSLAVGTTYTMTENTTFTAIYVNQDIYTVEELCTFRDMVNIGNSFEGKTINLMADLDLSSVCSSTKGSWVPIGDYASNENLCFAGNFNGNGHTISNIYINNNKDVQGLFGSVRNGSIDGLKTQGSVSGKIAVGGIVAGIYLSNSYEISNCISDVILVASNKQPGGIVGTICGNSTNTTIDKCKNIANLTSKAYDAGGIIGIIWDSSKNITISNCENTGTITCVYNAGGIVGSIAAENLQLNSNIKIISCKNSGIVKGDYSVGGIVGYIGYKEGITVQNCSNTGNITAQLDSVGGIVGVVDNKGKLTINYAFNKGSIYANRYASGGILGVSYTSSEAIIKNSYNEGTIGVGSSAYAGILGNIDADGKGTVQYCHNVGTISGSQYNKGAIVGYQNGTYSGTANYWLSTCGASYGIGKENTNTNATKYTAAQMKVQSNFAGWNFSTIWKMDTTKGYPVLRNMP